MICPACKHAAKAEPSERFCGECGIALTLDASVQPYLDLSPMRAAPAQSTEASTSSVALDSPSFVFRTIENSASIRQAMRRKYDFERDKRLRPDGPTQYASGWPVRARSRDPLHHQ